MDYQQSAAWAAERVEGYRRDPSGWRSCKRTDEVVVSWRPSMEFDGKLYKAEGIIPSKLENVFKCITPEVGGLRTKWDENVKELDIIEVIGDNVIVLRTTTPSAFMKIISPREFVDVAMIKREENGTVSIMASKTEHPRCPPRPNYVRAVNYPCGCICSPAPGEASKTHLLSFFQTDLGGNLPQSVVESFFPSNIMNFYSNLAKAVVKLTA